LFGVPWEQKKRAKTLSPDTTLGPLAGQQFRRALAISQGDLTIFFTQPISAGCLASPRWCSLGPPLWELLAGCKAVMA
jgi:putative tricarboxylic transport membrane protein